MGEGLLGQPQMVLGGGIGAGVWSPNYVIAETPWRHDKRRAGGGPVVDLGVHRFDVLRHICGPIESVSGLTCPMTYVFVCIRLFSATANGSALCTPGNDIRNYILPSLSNPRKTSTTFGSKCFPDSSIK